MDLVLLLLRINEWIDARFHNENSELISNEKDLIDLTMLSLTLIIVDNQVSL